MSEHNEQNRRNALSIIGLIFILGLLGFVAWKFLLNNNSFDFSRGDWVGNWEVTYYYQHVDSLS